MKGWDAYWAYLLTGIVMLTSSAVSAQQFDGTGVAGRFGTLGWGIEIVQSLQPSVNLRFGLNRFHEEFSDTEDSVDYTVDVNLRTVGLLADWHPYAGVFRVTGGALYNDSGVDLLGVPNAALLIGDSSYQPSDIGTLTYNVGFPKIAPYLGFGFGNALQRPQALSFVLDFGVLFSGIPEVDISASGWNALLPSFQADLAREEQKLEEDLRPFRYYPVIAFGLTFRFL